VADPACEQPIERFWKRRDPVRFEAVVTKRGVLACKLVEFRAVDCQPKASGTPERIAGQGLDPVERIFGELPQPPGPGRAERDPGMVVARATAAKGEASVSAASASRDRPGFEEPYAQAAASEGQGARAAGDAAPDHDDIDGREGLSFGSAGARAR
jgi:hypothetical protein